MRLSDANHACGRAIPLPTNGRNNEPYSNVLDRSSRRNLNLGSLNIPDSGILGSGVTVGFIVHVIPPVPMGNGANLRISWQKSRGILFKWTSFQVDVVSSCCHQGLEV